MYEASRQGDQEVVQWLDSCCKYERYKAMEYAASAGRLEVVMWLYDQEKQDTDKAEDTGQVQNAVYMVQPLETKLQVLNWVAVFPKKKCFREAFASRTGLLADVYDQRDPLLPWQDAEALAQRGDLFVLKQLYTVKHPQLFTQQTFAAILRYTKAGDLLQWFQTHSSTLMGDSAIVEWGVKYRQFAYLTYVFLKFQPKFTFFRKVPESSRKMKLVGAMANAAAGFGQLQPSDTSTSTIVETSFVSTEGLLKAMVHRHVDVVQWVCAVDIDLVSRQSPKRRGELATFLREEADGFVPSKVGTYWRVMALRQHPAGIMFGMSVYGAIYQFLYLLDQASSSVKCTDIGIIVDFFLTGQETYMLIFAIDLLLALKN
ncbi:Hypothetical protein PHPALM_4260, partial [Phytophthora palmivora]